MLKKSFLLIICMIIQGCSSNNIKPFHPNITTCKALDKKLKNVYVSVKAHDPQQNSVSCRLVGPIYLPGKITFQEYIQKAFESTLDHANALAHDRSSANHVIEIFINDINSSSLSGEWAITGTLSIDGKSSIPFKSATEYGTSFIAESACRNAAESFDHATEDLIKTIFSKL